MKTLLTAACALLAARPVLAIRITEYPAPSPIVALAVEPDGVVQLVTTKAREGVNGDPGVISLNSAGPANYLQAAAAGPTYMWVADAGGNKVIRLPLTNGSYDTFSLLTPSAGLSSMAVGPDGSAWVTEFSANKIGRVTPAGVVTEYPVKTAASGLMGITASEDGYLYFTEKLANKIGRIANDGTVEEFDVPTANSGPVGISATAGYVYFTESK